MFKKRQTESLNLSRSFGFNNDNLKQWEQRGGRRQHPGRDVGLDQARRRGQGKGDHQHHHLRRIPHRREEAISVQQRGKPTSKLLRMGFQYCVVEECMYLCLYMFVLTYLWKPT